MATNFPGNLDDLTSLPNPTSSSYTNSPSHAGLHDNENDSIRAIETKIGTGASTPAAGQVFKGTGAGVSAWATLAESDVTNLVSDLAAKAPLASPTFSGTVTVPAPVNPTDAVTKNYVDTQAAAEVTLTGTQTLTNKTINGNSNTLTVLAASQLSGVTPIANGGTGSSTQNFVDLTTAQTIAGVKTFSSAPVVPTASFPESAVTNLVSDLAAKATDTAVVHLAGTETVTGAKTFNAGTLLDKGSQTFNVKAYGAVGNGTTDDYPAINAAITAMGTTGGILFFPTGTYLTNSKIVLPSNVLVLGAGNNASTIKQGFAASGVDTNGMLNNSDTVNGNTNITIKDIQLLTTPTTGTAPNLTTSTTSVWFQGVSDVLIDGVISTNGSLVFKPLPAATAATVNTGGKNNRVKVCNTKVTGGAEAVYFQQGTDLEVTNCVFTGIYDSTLSINSSGERITISNNVMDGKGMAWASLGLIELTNDGAGDTNGIRDVSITGNVLLNSTNANTKGIVLQKVTNASVTGNTIRNVGDAGIRAGGGINLTITGNTIVSSGNNGIYVTNDYTTNGAIAIVGNTVNACTGAGIAFGGGSNTLGNITVDGNVLTSNSTYGINPAAAVTRGLISNNIANSNTSGVTAAPAAGWVLLDLANSSDSKSNLNSVWRGDTTNGVSGHQLATSGASAFTGDGALLLLSAGNASDAGKALNISHSGTNLNSTVMTINKYGTGAGRALDIANYGTGPALNITNNSTGYGAIIAGNVGINQASPSNKLHLTVGNVDGLRVESSNSGFIELGTTAGDRWRWANNYNSPVLELLYGASGAAPATSRLNITTSGLVGIGLGATQPTSQLQVNGAIATAFANKTAAYTLTATDSIISVDSTTAAFTVTLPDATTCTGRQYTIKKVDASANNVTIATAPNTQTIDGVTTKVVSGQWTVVRLVSNGTNWLVV